MNTRTAAALASPDTACDAPNGTVDEVDEIDAVDEEFYALVYSDPQWLRAEFDAIVAADTWGCPPSSTLSSRGRADHPSGGVRPEQPEGTAPASRVLPSVRGRGARTRSPPG
jgi:hypothetical protein